MSMMPSMLSLPHLSGAAPKAAQGDYGNAIKALQDSLKASQGGASSQMMQAQQQLQQNQGKVQQGLINSGLGNTTVAQTMQQAPLQTYNQAVAGIQDNLSHQQMQGYQNLAQGYMGQGDTIGKLLESLQSQRLSAVPLAQQQAAASPMNATYNKPNYIGG